MDLSKNYLYIALNSGDQGAYPSDSPASFTNEINSTYLIGPATDYEVALILADFTMPSNTLSGVYIFSDICGPSIVGNKMPNILCRAPRMPGNEGRTIAYSPKMLEWRPLNSTQFSQITIQLRTYDGAFLPNGKTIPHTFIQLVIRRKGTQF
jgi:hypothetical protein